MKYTDLTGNPRNGIVWSAGPISTTAWVFSDASEWAVVSVRTRKQVPYEMPIFGPPVPAELSKWSDSVVSPDIHSDDEDERAVALLHRTLGAVPVGPVAETARVVASWRKHFDETAAAIRSYRKTDGDLTDNRYADRASVAAKTLLALEKEQ